MYTCRSSCKEPVILVRFSKNTEMSNFMKIRLVRAMRTGGQTDMTKLIVLFRNFAKALTNRVLPHTELTVCTFRTVNTDFFPQLCVLRAGLNLYYYSDKLWASTLRNPRLPSVVLLQTRPVCYLRHGGFSSRYSHPSTRPTWQLSLLSRVSPCL